MEGGKIAAPGFPSVAGSSATFDADDEGTTTKNEGAFPGEFDGAAGTFECVATGGGQCTVTRDADGKIGDLEPGLWEFTPDDGVTVQVADDDYLHYGFWLKKSEKEGVTTYNEVQTFAGSSLDKTAGNLRTSIMGTAKYEGDAAGVYVNKALTPDGSTDEAFAGTFTADVALTAYFGVRRLRCRGQTEFSGRHGFQLHAFRWTVK